MRLIFYLYKCTFLIFTMFINFAVEIFFFIVRILSTNFKSSLATGIEGELDWMYHAGARTLRGMCPAVCSVRRHQEPGQFCRSPEEAGEQVLWSDPRGYCSPHSSAASFPGGTENRDRPTLRMEEGTGGQCSWEVVGTQGAAPGVRPTGWNGQLLPAPLRSRPHTPYWPSF